MRVTLTGDDLVGFEAQGPDDHVKLIFHPSDAESDQDRGFSRDYTPGEYRPAVGLSGSPKPELDIDFVVHANAGPASAWAAEAKPGDQVAVGGPRGSKLPPSGFRRMVLLADESALPALCRWLTAVEPTTEIVAVVESEDPAILDYLPAIDSRTSVIQVGPGEGTILAALSELPIDQNTYVWAGGEATTLIPIRRYLRGLGLGREQMFVRGYWKRGVAGLDHHAPLDPDDPED